MIGYLTESVSGEAVDEIFQLLKVPAEPYRPAAAYGHVISDGATPPAPNWKTLVVYSSHQAPIDADLGLTVVPIPRRRVTGMQPPDLPPFIPILSGLSEVSGVGVPLLNADDGRIVATSIGSASRKKIVRIGFGLYQEIERLLTKGQDGPDAGIPTLEMHLSILRRLLRLEEVLIEVPPVPWQRNLALTLSHDIDHLSLAEHGFGEKWMSFVRQSTVWPLMGFLRRRIDFRTLIRAWGLATISPLIILGLMSDPWTNIERYVELEQGVGAKSTYFFIPFKGRAGIDLRKQRNHRRRQADYDVRNNTHRLLHLSQAGVEIGLHGIDAWHSEEAAKMEARELESVVGVAIDGVRMHYLYSDDNSAKVLDESGFRYDSTVGYPRRVGFRTGTLQPYKPVGVEQLLEFPVHLEDGSLLSPAAGFSSERDARRTIDNYFRLAQHFGGALNVSWHDHSLEPPRSWDGPYNYLLQKGAESGAWMTCLVDACNWFLLRRSVRLLVQSCEEGRLVVRVEMLKPPPGHLPPLRLRVHLPLSHACLGGPVADNEAHVDVQLRPGLLEVTLQGDRIAVEQVEDR